MEYRPSVRTELNIFFTNEEISQIAAITDYINRLYPKLDEVLLEFTQEQAQEQADFWHDILNSLSSNTTPCVTPKLIDYVFLEKTQDGIAISFRRGDSHIYFGNSLQYASFDIIPDESSLSVSKERCRELSSMFYGAVREDLVSHGWDGIIRRG